MKDQLIALQVTALALVQGLGDRLKNQRGQGAAEYIGIILVVAAIIAFVVTQGSSIGQAIVDGITNAINSISG